MYLFKLYILVNVVFIGAVTLSKSVDHGPNEENLLNFGNRIRSHHRFNKIEKQFSLPNSLNGFKTKAVGEGNYEKELELTKHFNENALKDVEMKKTKKLHPKRLFNLQNTVVNKQQPKFSEKKKKNNFKLGKPSTNEMKSLLLAKLFALQKPIKKVNSSATAPKHEYTTMTSEKRNLSPDQQVFDMVDNSRFVTSFYKKFTKPEISPIAMITANYHKKRSSPNKYHFRNYLHKIRIKRKTRGPLDMPNYGQYDYVYEAPKDYDELYGLSYNPQKTKLKLPPIYGAYTLFDYKRDAPNQPNDTSSNRPNIDPPQNQTNGIPPNQPHTQPSSSDQSNKQFSDLPMVHTSPNQPNDRYSNIPNIDPSQNQPNGFPPNQPHTQPSSDQSNKQFSDLPMVYTSPNQPNDRYSNIPNIDPSQNQPNGFPPNQPHTQPSSDQSNKQFSDLPMVYTSPNQPNDRYSNIPNIDPSQNQPNGFPPNQPHTQPSSDQSNKQFSDLPMVYTSPNQPNDRYSNRPNIDPSQNQPNGFLPNQPHTQPSSGQSNKQFSDLPMVYTSPNQPNDRYSNRPNINPSQNQPNDFPPSQQNDNSYGGQPNIVPPNQPSEYPNAPNGFPPNPQKKKTRGPLDMPNYGQYDYVYEAPKDYDELYGLSYNPQKTKLKLPPIYGAYTLYDYKKDASNQPNDPFSNRQTIEPSLQQPKHFFPNQGYFSSHRDQPNIVPPNQPHRKPNSHFSIFLPSTVLPGRPNRIPNWKNVRPNFKSNYPSSHHQIYPNDVVPENSEKKIEVPLRMRCVLVPENYPVK
ncbi:uncharacterized protein [Rhodnius prolixus]|uniref:uncharacterized protein n=1 Tax=Rhodnius prolixus TaxID=13249 RepID=UPI003D187F80